MKQDERSNETTAGEGLTRRRFLRDAGVVSAAGFTSPLWLSKAASAATNPTGRDVLVHVFLRGGMDGLTTCVPYGDPELQPARPDLAIAPPGATNGAVDLDGFFGLAPAAAPLKTIYDAGRLAIVHAVGSTDSTRSHFDAFKAMERGLPEQDYDSVSTGWLARHLLTTPPLGGGLLRALAMDDLMPLSLGGAPQTLPIPDPALFSFPGDPLTSPWRQRAIEAMYERTGEPLSGAAQSTFDTIEMMEAIDFDGYVPENGAVYPASPFGDKLKRAAALIKAQIDLECLFIDYGGWDHHNTLGPIDGVMASMLDDLSRSLEAFHLDLLDHQDDVTGLVISEFGRRVAQNDSLGLDHGHGGCLMVFGGHVAGGQVFTSWPGLAPAALDQGDLAITTDYRDVVGEILVRRLGTTDLAAVFPGYTPNFHGIVV